MSSQLSGLESLVLEVDDCYGVFYEVDGKYCKICGSRKKCKEIVDKRLLSSENISKTDKYIHGCRKYSSKVNELVDYLKIYPDLTIDEKKSYLAVRLPDRTLIQIKNYRKKSKSKKYYITFGTKAIGIPYLTKWGNCYSYVQDNFEELKEAISVWYKILQGGK